MPRVLCVFTRRPRNIGYELAAAQISHNLDCICLKYVTRKIDWLVPERLQQSVGESTITALQKMRSEGVPYDFIITDSPEAAHAIESINMARTGMTYHPPVLIQCPSDDMCRLNGFKTAQELRNEGFHAFSAREMLTTNEMIDTCTLSELDKQIESVLGEEGIKRLACEPHDSVQSVWWNSRTSARELGAHARGRYEGIA